MIFFSFSVECHLVKVFVRLYVRWQCVIIKCNVCLTQPFLTSTAPIWQLWRVAVYYREKSELAVISLFLSVTVLSEQAAGILASVEEMRNPANTHPVLLNFITNGGPPWELTILITRTEYSGTVQLMTFHVYRGNDDVWPLQKST